MLLVASILYPREFFQGQRWNEDPTYHSPMVTIGSTNICIGDIVTFNHNMNGAIVQGLGKVKKFYRKV